MAIKTAPPEEELKALEEQALEHIAEDGVGKIEDIAVADLAEERPPLPVRRLIAVVCFPVLAAAAMAGGVFIGFSPRIYAAVAGILGVLLAVGASRTRRQSLLYLVSILGLAVIAVLLVLPDGLKNVFDIGAHIRRSIISGDVQRPPVLFDSGWKAITGILLGGLGFACGWLSFEVRRPAISMLLPLPVIAFTAISVPDSDQIPTGLVALVLFAIGLGMLSGTEMGGDESQRRSLAFELRRGLKSLPMVGVVIGALVALTQLNILFPDPLFDPTQEAKKPRTIPLSEVKDRVLFKVSSNITGPWRMGHLDVFDGKDWRLPPFAQTRLKEVPKSGVVDSELTPGVRADFEVAEIGGAVLPGLPNTVGIVADGPKLAFDSRLGNIRLAQGQIEVGTKYSVVAAVIPSVEELRTITGEVPDDIRPFLEIPDPPPAVRDLLAQAPTTSIWDKMDFMRQHFLQTVTSSGSGVPTSVPPSRVDDMLGGSKRGTPYEIVAAQAMLARWAGVPSRIGYGYDGGDQTAEQGILEVRPKHGASFMEVYFPNYKWLPVIGTPLQAETSLSDDPQQFNPNVLATNDVAVKLQVPIALDARTLLFAQIRRIVLIVLPIVIGALLIYYTWPAVHKAFVRARLRNWAHHEGDEARIALAYAEWRDTATDFGYRFDADTPLMFLDRIVEDDEHTELAWLVTRTLWGDLKDGVRAEDALAAEELSRALRRRLAQAHPSSLRAIAAVSRLSLRYPYWPVHVPRGGKEGGELAPAPA